MAINVDAKDKLLTMTEAALELKLSSGDSARRLLKGNQVPLVAIHNRLCLVEQRTLMAFVVRRRGRGRPRKAEAGIERQKPNGT